MGERLDLADYEPDMVTPSTRFTTIGLDWEPDGWPGVAILDKVNAGGRVTVTIRAGDRVEVRKPNHHQVFQLKPDPGKPVIEIRRVDGSRQVYRSGLVTVEPEDGYAWPGGRRPAGLVRAGQGFVVNATVPAVELSKRRWRWVYEDLLDDLATGRLGPGDKLPSEDRLAGMYSLARGTVARAVRALKDEGRLEGHQRRGRYVTAS